MKKSVELLNEIKEAKVEMSAFKAENKLDEAMKVVNKIENLKKEMTIAELEEEAVVTKVKENKIENKGVNSMKITNKMINEEIKNIAKGEIRNDATVGIFGTNAKAVLPVETIAEIQQIRAGFLPLRPFCKNIEVYGNSGSEIKPMEAYVSGNALVRTSATYESIPFQLSSVGAITGIGESEINDACVDIVADAFQDFAEASVLTENLRIVKALVNAPVVVGKDYKDIVKALGALVPSVRQGAKVYCNSEAYTFITNLEDKAGRPICGVDIQDSTKNLLRGYEIVEVNPAVMPTNGAMDFYVGDMSKAVGFLFKNGIEMAISHDSAFDTDCAELKVKEQMAVIELMADKCMKKVTLPLGVSTVVAK